MTFSLNKLLQWLILALLFPLIFVNGWLALKVLQYFQPLVNIFVLATLLAFILNYPVRFLHHRGVKRNYAVLFVFVPTLLIFVALGVTLIPFLLEEFHEVAKVIPDWINSASQKLHSLHDFAVSKGLPVNLSQLASQLTDRFPGELEYLADKLLSLALDTIDSISDVLLTVVISFYLLADAERIWDGISQKFPPRFSFQLQQAIQQNFQNYFIGQIALACLVGFSMITMFLILKVRFALLFGLTVGIMTLIPFGDVVSLGVIILLIASQDFLQGAKVLGVAIIIDQTIDQAIAPRLLGSFTGLRPIWVLVALLLGTKIGGLLGLLIAVPVASSIKSVADNWHSLESYSSKVTDTQSEEC